MAEQSETNPAWHDCFTCRDYATQRREALAEPLADKTRAEGRNVVEVVDEFMLAAHGRHLSGTPLRDGGPTSVINPALARLSALIAEATR